MRYKLTSDSCYYFFMTKEILKWDIYEITTKESSIQGVMFRGRVRKFALENNVTLLTENASDKENTVRFAVLEGLNVQDIIKFITSLIPDTDIRMIEAGLQNPVLSKMKVNRAERYNIN